MAVVGGRADHMEGVGGGREARMARVTVKDMGTDTANIKDTETRRNRII